MCLSSKLIVTTLLTIYSAEASPHGCMQDIIHNATRKPLTQLLLDYLGHGYVIFMATARARPLASRSMAAIHDNSWAELELSIMT